MYATLTIGGTDYKMRLGAAHIMELEKHLGGRNPLDILMNVEKGALPPLTDTLRILHASMQQFQHGVSFADAMRLYDQYVADGGSYIELIPSLIEVFRVSGFFREAPAAAPAEKAKKANK
ncbi:DUF6096 family protein [Paenibacillus paeoniae]|uniref:Uncharacterized protein n=1 Tax=Paenibacillus paeoniae TaxID=2292705 RepID=A0A371P091_9BACL|nr:DUF6096 family protein [Paenibacillus paeoniae]REK69343.1 hypothetical protein DX130_24595 [Paenibacillus paeoniae]